MSNQSHAPEVHRRTRRIASALVIAAGLMAAHSDAEAGFFDGVNAYLQAVCPVTGNVVYSAASYTGYDTDPSYPYPQVGDIGYVHAVAYNISPCSNDVMAIEVALPAGATLARSDVNQVVCTRGRSDGGFFETVPNASNSACFQSPAAGPNGGAMFGWSALPPGWWIEIRIPVIYHRALHGLAGGAAARLAATTTTTNGTMTATQQVTAPYRVQLWNLVTSASNGGSLAFDFYNFFEAGQLYVDYGTTTAFGLTMGPLGVANSYESLPVTASFSGLTPGTVYYWRVRYVTALGTFHTPTQSFNIPIVFPWPFPRPGPPQPPRPGSGLLPSAVATEN